MISRLHDLQLAIEEWSRALCGEVVLTRTEVSAREVGSGVTPSASVAAANFDTPQVAGLL
jgi:hypothetical protein